jgi:hypothetical protein
MNWIELAQYRDMFLGFVNELMEFVFHKMRGICCLAVSFSRRTLLLGAIITLSLLTHKKRSLNISAESTYLTFVRLAATDFM